MAMVSFGDLAQSFLLKAQTVRLKTDLGRVTQELASGRLTDVGASLSGDFMQLGALTRSRAITEGYQFAAASLALQAEAAQATLSSLSDSAQALVTPLFSASQLTSADQIALLGHEARQRLTDAVAALNTSVGGRALFSGAAVAGPALADPAVILDAVRTALTGVTTAAQAMTRLSDWFDDPAGFATVAYQGGQALDAVSVGASQSVALDITANSAGLRRALQGFVAASLIADPGVPLPVAEWGAMARAAAEAMMTGQSALTDTAARIGIAESRIETARSRNAADLLTLELTEAGLTQGDPYRLSSELEAVQTNLELLYSVTARLSRLSLTDFLR